MRHTTILISILVLASLYSFSKIPKLSITSPAFMADQMIPVKYSCKGEEVSPPLHIDNIPSGSKTLAIIVHDPDAPMKGGFTHWVVWNIDVMPDIPEHFDGGQVGINGASGNSYKGMCPPSGTHRYHFMVYALDSKLDMNIHADKKSLEKKMVGHILAKGELIGLFQK